MALTPAQEDELRKLQRDESAGDLSSSGRRRLAELQALKVAAASTGLEGGGQQTQPGQQTQTPGLAVPMSGAGTAFNPDLFGGGRATLPSEPAIPADYWVSDPVPVKEAGQIIGYVRKWQFIWYGGFGGLGVTYGDLQRHHDRVGVIESIPLDNRFPRFSFLPTDLAGSGSQTASGPFAGLHHQNIFDTLIMGVGDGANQALWKETSATDPTPTAITYSPGAATPISCLGAITIGAATNAKRLVVGRIGAAAQIISDATGTVDATMDAGSASMWAIAQTILNKRPILAYCGNSILKWFVTSTATAAADETPWTNLPAGGFGIGLQRRGADGPMRWYLVLPHTTNTAGMLTFGSEKPGYVMSFDQEGLDPQELGPDDFLGIKDVYQAAPWDRGVVVTDFKRIVVNRGAEGIEEITPPLDAIFGNSVLSAKQVYYRGFWVKGPELIVQVCNVYVNGPINTWLEAYNPVTKRWYQVSAVQSSSVTNQVVGTLGAGAMPWSLTTYNVHTSLNTVATATVWTRKFEPPFGINPFVAYNYGELDETDTGPPGGYETAAGTPTTRTPKLIIPNCQGWPLVVSRITRLGRNTADPSTATVTYTVGGVSATFNEVSLSSIRADIADRESFPDNRSYFYQLQLKVEFARGSNDSASANAAPVMVEGYAFIGMPPRPPRFIRDEEIGIAPSPFTGFG